MGRNGIKEKAPSGAISALMRGGGGRDKVATTATQPSESTGPGSLGQMGCSPPYAECQGCLATATPTGYSAGNKRGTAPHVHG